LDVGNLVGVADGGRVGAELGLNVGNFVGLNDGVTVGAVLGLEVGKCVGETVFRGAVLGCKVGELGTYVGATVGIAEH